MKFYFKLSHKYGNRSPYLDSKGDAYKTMITLYLNAIDLPDNLRECTVDNAIKTRNFLKDYEYIPNMFNNVTKQMLPTCNNITGELESIISVLTEGAGTKLEILLGTCSAENYELSPSTLIEVFIQNPKTTAYLAGRLIKEITGWEIV